MGSSARSLVPVIEIVLEDHGRGDGVDLAALAQAACAASLGADD
jgi:hypothetical protein